MLRWGWFVLGATVCAAVTWRVFSSDISIQLADLRTSDVLSIALAFFSVWLAVNFYHKANEASNRFYHDSYQFTKQVSEVLARIEVGFGTQLRHLDEGLARLPGLVRQSEAEAEESEEEATTKQAEVTQLIETILAKSKLNEDEKRNFLQRLEEAQKQLAVLHATAEHSRAEADKLRAELASVQRDGPRSHPVPTISRHVLPVFARAGHDFESLAQLSPAAIRSVFEANKEAFSETWRTHARQQGYVDENGSLTFAGARLIRSVVRRRASG